MSQPQPQRADVDLLNELITTADILLDCSDNFAARHASGRNTQNHRAHRRAFARMIAHARCMPHVVAFDWIGGGV